MCGVTAPWWGGHIQETPVFEPLLAATEPKADGSEEGKTDAHESADDRETCRREHRAGARGRGGAGDPACRGCSAHAAVVSAWPAGLATRASAGAGGPRARAATRASRRQSRAP